MKNIIALFVVESLLMAPTALAQRGNHGRGNGGNHSGRDGHFDRSRHGRVDRDRDVRIVGNRREVFFDGFWFGCDIWPEWVFAGDVYVLTVDDGYVMYSYANPSLFISINIVP